MARKIYKARKFQDNNLRSSCEGRHLYNKMCGVPCSAEQWCPPLVSSSSGDPVLAMVISNLSIRIQQSHNTPTLDWNGDLSKVTDESFRLSIHKFIFDRTVYRRGQTLYFGKYYSKAFYYGLIQMNNPPLVCVCPWRLHSVSVLVSGRVEHNELLMDSHAATLTTKLLLLGLCSAKLQI